MALSKLDSLYMAVVADHSKHPHHQGQIEDVDQIQLNNPTCGDVIQLSVKFDENDRVEDIAFDNAAIVGSVSELTSFAADIIVIDIFVPVSPSGTGNTFNSLIHSFLLSRFLAPAKNIFASILASIVFTATVKSSLINHSYTFYINVDLVNLHAGEFFYFVFYTCDQVV